jgi:hypothetical protein
MKESGMNYKRQAIYEFADCMTRKGLVVYISDSIHFCYGIVTHPDVKNILYFQYELFGDLSFSSCCRPSKSHGTGCKMDESSRLDNDDDVQLLIKKLNSCLPDWYRRNESDRLTLEQYLKMKQTADYKLYEVNDNASN